MLINLVVIFGGKSVEHEVSIISAVQAMQNLDATKYNIMPVYMTKSNAFYSGDKLFDIENYKNLPNLMRELKRVKFEVFGDKTYLVPDFARFLPTNWCYTRERVIDVVLPVVHGTNVEDGVLQGFLQSMNLAYAGPDVLSAAICMDKFISKVLLKQAGFPVLDALLFDINDYADAKAVKESIEDTFGYPVIVKPVNLGSSIGISKAESAETLYKALSEAFSFSKKIIVEQAISPLREINCAVLGDADEAIASECEEPIAVDKILSYSDKYMGNAKGNSSQKMPSSSNNAENKAASEKIEGAVYVAPKTGMASLQRKVPADITPELRDYIRDTAVKAFRYLGLNGVARLDFIIKTDTNEPVINEFNTIPGSLSYYLFEPIGINYSELLDRIINLALNRAQKSNDITYSFDTNILSSVGGSIKK
ncbi:MAG: D-alanine--D-alanine ligase [Bifidobacteriaceae bacterium]|jgi:D-alanine-D-alanine ligase|nr:D-alanine--D-alanine ligase [Bifidobacteriaceae bacterium]